MFCSRTSSIMFEKFKFWALLSCMVDCSDAEICERATLSRSISYTYTAGVLFTSRLICCWIAKFGILSLSVSSPSFIDSTCLWQAGLILFVLSVSFFDVEFKNWILSFIEYPTTGLYAILFSILDFGLEFLI